MSILTIQRRLVERGRLRAGEQVTTSNGKRRPAKRETWRITSRDPQSLADAAKIYGGEVKPWDGHDGEYVLDTTVDALDVAVVPGQAISQHMELWGQEHPRNHKGPNPVVCLRRCDGVQELMSGSACLCAQQEEPDCKPTTRLSVVLTKVRGLGVWRVETRGWNAAAELTGAVQLLEALVASRRPVRARLRLEQRRQVTRRGERHFVVPVLDIDHTLDEVLALTQGPAAAAPAVAGAAGGALEAPSVPFTPVPALPAPDEGTVAEQLAAPVVTGARGPHVPIKPTGRSPRKRQGGGEAGDREAPEISDETVPGVGSPPSGDGPVDGSATSLPPDEPPDPETRGLPLAQSIAKWCSEVGLSADERHAFLADFSDGRYSSSKDVPADEIPPLRALLIRMKRGELALRRGKIVETGRPADAPAWAEEVEKTPGIGPAKFLAAAKRIAAQKLGADAANAISDYAAVPDAITGELLGWLGEKRNLAAAAR